jgi:DNA segregation ATPase FtsK/SpoIIIE, S-DNA-T family
MRTSLTLLRPDGSCADLVVSADAGATVGEIARALRERDPDATTTPARTGPRGPALTLAVMAAPDPGRTAGEPAPGSATGQSLDPGGLFAESPMPAGAWVRLVSGAAAGDASVGGPALATVHVLRGPDAGTSVALHRPTSVLGRGGECDVRLSDPLVSRRHARLTVGGTVEMVDLDSANGILSGGEVIRRAELGPQDEVQLGESVVRVESHRLLDPAQARTGRGVLFNRSPLVRPATPGVTVAAPTPPSRRRGRRFPMIALAVPVLMAGVLYAVLPSPFVLVFLAMSPLMLAGQWLDDTYGSRREHRSALREYQAELRRLRGRLSELSAQERAQRLDEHHDVERVARAVIARDPLLWSRRPAQAGWLELRLGLGERPSRHRVTLPSRNDAPGEQWAELEEVARLAGRVDAVPVVASLVEAGALGFAGPGPAVHDAAAAAVLQLAGLHSPGELVLALLTDAAGAGRWEWLRWLPHTAPEHSPLGVSHLATDEGSGRALLSGLEEVVLGRRAASAPAAALPAVVLVLDDDAPAERSRVAWLAAHGPSVGVHLLQVAPSVERLLSACAVYVELPRPASGPVLLGRVADGGAQEVLDPVVVDTVRPQRCAAVARACAPLVDAAAAASAGADLPSALPLVSLVGPELAEEPAAVLERWALTGTVTGADGRMRRGHHHLIALVGTGREGPFYLDLRGQGPHALVGGTTGAGKSEFLQSWVIGLASTYGPGRVTFLFVDYKGGAAFGDCVRLPHSVGMITDLSPSLFARTLVSLRAELRRRERLLASHRAKDLLELERRGHPETPPALVIVVDEFAALAGDLPEFVDGMVDIAQRGRSLGVHLILATQRPAGVIKDNLRANTNLRIALRMADAADSSDVLGATDAAAIPPDLPGRGYAKTGPGRVVGFQAGYAGGWTSTEPEPARIRIETLQVGGCRCWPDPVPDGPDPRIETGAPTDLQRLVATIRAAAETRALLAPTPPWLPPLRPAYRWQDLRAAVPQSGPESGPDPGVFLLAQRDDPDQQAQYAVGFAPDREGNLAVFGTGGTGKTTLLRTLAAAALARTGQAGPTHVYGLDFGGHGLAPLERLPNVGAVIAGEDVERLNRLLRQLTATVNERAARFAAAGAGSLAEYRDRAGRPNEPRILVLVDGVQVFRHRHESRGPWERFLALAADGRGVGVHVCVAADRPASVPGALQSVVQKRVHLRMVEEDYQAAGMAALALGPTAPPGRGHLDGYEIQVSVLDGAASVADQARALADLATRTELGAQWPSPQPVGTLPDFVALADLPPTLHGDPVIGVAEEDLAAVGVPIRSTFLVAGPPGSGRTTALAAVAAACVRSGRYSMSAYLGTGRTPVASGADWDCCATDPDAIATLARTLASRMAEPSCPRTVVVLESLHDVATGAAEAPLLALARACAVGGHAFLTDADLGARMFTDLALLIRSGRQGLVLRPGSAVDGQGLLSTNTPPVAGPDVPGRGVLVGGGTARAVQIAVPVPHLG